MSLSNVPREIILGISDHLDDAELNALVRIHSQIYDFLNTPLYRRDLTRPPTTNKSLLWAANNGVKGTIQRALSAGRYLQGPVPEAYNIALQTAAGKGHVDIVELLLEVTVDGTDENFGPLQISIRRDLTSAALLNACRFGHVSVVKHLLTRGNIDLNALGFDSRRSALIRPLTAACEGGYVEIINLLLAEDDIDVNLDTEATPLNTAVRKGLVEVVKSLLAREDLNPNIVVHGEGHVRRLKDAPIS
jgi:ankyrin repeat protein